LTLAVALALIGVGVAWSWKIYEPAKNASDERFFRRIADRQLIVDSTFGGVARQSGRLVSTYDRDKPRGKTSCPT
jgi:hypothetical protein